MQVSYWGELALQPCDRHQLDGGGWGRGRGKLRRPLPHAPTPLSFLLPIVHPLGGTFFLSSLPLPKKLKMVAELFTMWVDCKTVVFGRFRKARSAVSAILACGARTPVASLPILPRRFHTRSRPRCVRILTVARVRKKYDCFVVYDVSARTKKSRLLCRLCPIWRDTFCKKEYNQNVRQVVCD